MRWFWQRRKKPESSAAPDEMEVRRGGVATAPRPAGASGRLASSLASAAELRDELLRFTRDLLNTQGARVRVEDDDLLSATLPDGSTARYTTTLARARAEDETTLLAQGATALQALFDQAAERSRVVALRLPASGDPAALAREWLAPLADRCGRCAGLGDEPWLAGAPTCDVCPLRAGRLALTWEQPPAGVRVVSQRDARSIELVYRLIGRDRGGRRDEWLRLAFEADHPDAAPLPPLALDRIAEAQPAELASADAASLARVSARAQERLRPALDAWSATLQQRVDDDYQRRVAEVTATHERLRRERPDEARSVEAALERELASLAEIYSVEIEARLESVIFITSPIAQVMVENAAGVGPTVTVDLGRGLVSAPDCAICGGETRAGHICAAGHAVCATHLTRCAHCGAIRCPACARAPLTTCALCSEAACDNCATRCDACSRTFCADHIWRCVEGDATLCLEHLTVCGDCGEPVCAAHASRCGECGAARCPRHTRRCATCGEARCADHAVACGTCGQPLCAAHAVACEECGQSLCAADVFTCLGCGRALCGHHRAAACATCGVEYCARCGAESAQCPACRAAVAPDDGDLAALRLAAEREPRINLKRKWQVGQNALARVFIARGLGHNEVWVVTRQGEVIGAQRKGWLGS